MTIRFDLGHDLDLQFSRSNIEFAISQPKMVRLPRNEKQTYRLNSRAQMWPSGLTLAMTLTFNFQGQIYNLLYLSQKWNEKQTYRLNSRPQMWPMGLTLTFEFWRSNVTLTFDRTPDLDHGFSWSNFEIAVSQNGRADWHYKRCGSRSFMTMTMTIWCQGQVYGSTR